MNMDDPKRNFQGVWIPAAMWLDRSLSITEKVMLVEINSLQDAERGCFASNDRIAEFFDLSKSRVSEIIGNLADKNLVRVELVREGKQIVERQVWMTEAGLLLAGGIRPYSENTHTPVRKTRRTPSENTTNPFGKDSDPSSEKAKESNTDSNNTKSNTESITVNTIPPPKKSASENLLSEINHQVSADFLAIRKAKNIPLTQTALNGIKRESEKLGYSLEQALRVCCERGWAGFKAEWVLKDQVNGTVQNSRDQENKETTQRAKERLFGSQTEKDVTNETTRL